MIEYKRDRSPLMQKSSAFSVRVSNMVDYLSKNRNSKLYSIYDQVLRSGTSIMSNVSESQFVQSSADFISKLHIALKEANETMRWITFLGDKGCLTNKGLDSMCQDFNEIIAMLVASIKTSKRNQQIIVK